MILGQTGVKLFVVRLNFVNIRRNQNIYITNYLFLISNLSLTEARLDYTKIKL